tara:strand:+ start:11741 stop:12130 length:390 start_codon:yes stop_codon:yes gene_type:complete
MAVSEQNIRDLLNFPKGLNSGTITEYISVREAQINKIARGSLYLNDSSAYVVSTAEKDAAVKALVAVDCLTVLLDTIPTYVPTEQQRENDIRLRAQLDVFKKRADDLVANIAEAGSTAYAEGKTATRLE